ncbi:DNA-binding protein H-NS [Alcanivorax sp. S71-1-4]|jgi:DNA-binding protein H-NS|uniref:H-NS histone family protein n=1 Tax=Alcanivorax sp. S71-1-4 TaxID=1177159 RepID=UPI0013576A79|nr:H-NS histone family protein [Alcanivorax sp. S71-1-4]KAF0809587.1 DNA-binding protein H-NS [Alcanivorax sp. S71-1-4]
MNINLAPLSISELEQLIADANTLIERKKNESIRNAKAEIEKIAAEAGLTIEELMGIAKPAAGGAGKGSRKPAAVKFRHPKDENLTWSGRGKRPNWLQDELAKGKKLEDFAV